MSGSQNANVRLIFLRRKKFQAYAIVITVVAMFSALWKLKHPGVFTSTLSEDTVSWLIIGIIALFAVFTFFNWKCPACGKYLGSNITQKRCRKCGVSFG